jgi:hypothetical protein
MGGGVKVFSGVLVLRGIAATDVAADEAQAQVNPAIVQLQTLLATTRMGFDRLDFIEVSTSFHGISPFLLLR